MRVPEALQPLVDQGVVDEVIRPLMSGKEAQVYLVAAQGERRIAKVYKQATQRSFKHRADYTEGRRVRNTRQQRAMNRRSRYGRAQAEAEWRTAEVDAIYKLDAAGVRVPRPFDFVEGVLVMELIADARGEPAPRLVDVPLMRPEAEALFEQLVREVVKMLCAGVVHGDLSDFNVLMGVDGPVIIDFPQVVDPAFNRNARKLLLRDVSNLAQFLGRRAPRVRQLKYGPEMWDLYEKGSLRPDTALTGRWSPRRKKADTQSLLDELAELERESLRRREELGLGPPRLARTPVASAATPKPVRAADASTGGGEGEAGSGGRKRRRRRRRREQGPEVVSVRSGARSGATGRNTSAVKGPDKAEAEGAAGGSSSAEKPARRRRRRRRRRRSGSGEGGTGSKGDGTKADG